MVIASTSVSPALTGSTGVQNADAAPYADNPGISLGNNQAGMFQMSGTNRVVNQIGGAMSDFDFGSA